MLKVKDLISKYQKKIADLKAKAIALRNVKEIDRFDYINELNRINTTTRDLDEMRFSFSQTDLDAAGIENDTALTVREMISHIDNLNTIIAANGANSRAITDRSFEQLLQSGSMENYLTTLDELTQDSIIARDQRARFLLAIPLGDTEVRLATVQNLRIEDEMIMWDTVQHATEYIVKLVHITNGTTRTYTIHDEPGLSVTNLTIEGYYEIIVIASAPGNLDVSNSEPAMIRHQMD